MSVVGRAGIQPFDCPYCRQTLASLFSFQAVTISAAHFGMLLARGWCRCGSMIYKPDPNIKCCPQFSMRVRASGFSPTRKHRRTLRNMSIQPMIRLLGRHLTRILIEMGFISRELEYPYPSWLLRPIDGTIQSDVVQQLLKRSGIVASDPKLSNLLMHFLIHNICESTSVALKSLKFDGSGSMYFHSSHIGQCSFCECGAEATGFFAKRLVFSIKSERDECISEESIYIDPDVLEKWDSTKKRSPKLKSIDSSKCDRHVRHWHAESRGQIPFEIFGEAIDNNIEITMEPLSFTEEKFQLYSHYQMTVHADQSDFPTRERFMDYLVKSPITNTEDGYGSFHRCYRLRDTGELIAFTLLDIVPSGINSQYFVWNQKYKPWSLGIFSVLDEICLTQRRAAEKLVQPFYYFGIYVENCAKMMYKRQFKPSELIFKRDWTPTFQALEANAECLANNELDRLVCDPIEISRELLIVRNSAVTTYERLRMEESITSDQMKELVHFSAFVGNLSRLFIYLFPSEE